ncbi:MAG: NfeD family protein [Bacteroidia bacterium]|nr:NfeD family protein [Bacteroidia bacterium]
MSFFSFFGKSGSESEDENGERMQMGTFKGRLARATTPLKSMGFITLDGQTYEAMSTQGFIPEGSLVKITGFNMGNLTVESAE